MIIFDRVKERRRIKELVLSKRPIVVQGPAGVGKTFLLRTELRQLPAVLYCEECAATEVLYRGLARRLWTQRAGGLQAAFHSATEIEIASAASLKRALFDALRRGSYGLALDHCVQPPAEGLGTINSIDELLACGIAPLIIVTRQRGSCCGWISKLYSRAPEFMEIENFPPPFAHRFVKKLLADRRLLPAENDSDFIERIIELADGNPGAIVAMIEMGNYPKYRSERIDIAELASDFLKWKDTR